MGGNELAVLATLVTISILTNIGQVIKSYMSEKSKNFATKQDIENITEKIERVKNIVSLDHKRSFALVERQIGALDEMLPLVQEFQTYCFRSMDGSEHSVPAFEISKKSSFQRATEIREKLNNNYPFLPKATRDCLNNLSQFAFDIGTMEFHCMTKENEHLMDFSMYSSGHSKATSALETMWLELNENQSK